jgi:hypothetical protein
MHIWLLLLTVLPSAEPLEDGSLLFLENCSSVVQRATHGSVGHVAVVMNEQGGAFVYEAIPGGVRKLKLDDYYAELARLNARKNEEKQIKAYLVRPYKPFSETEREAMRHYLDEQIGRRYSVKSYVRGQEGAGVHCAELASHTLNESGRYQWEYCQSISPSELEELVDPSYHDRIVIGLPAPPAEESWCQRAQRRWDRVRTWCLWSCGEVWSFCR